MTALPVPAAPVQPASGALDWLSSFSWTPSGPITRMAVLLDRTLAVAVLALMVVAGLVITVVTLGVLTGFID